MKTKVRDSNYELLRIISMIWIVIWHTVINSALLYRTSGSVNFSFNFLFMIIVVHVNLFMLITGYYQSKSEFKLKKVISFLLENVFNLSLKYVLKLSCINDILFMTFLNKYGCKSINSQIVSYTSNSVKKLSNSFSVKKQFPVANIPIALLGLSLFMNKLS